MRTTVAIAALVAGLAVLSACSGDDGGASATGDGTSTSPTETSLAPVETTGPVLLEDPRPGEVQVVIGRSLDTTLEVTECERTPGAEPEDQVPAQLLGLDASGTSADGAEVDLDVRRFVSQGASATITDTVTVIVGDPDDPEQALVAQRFEVDGAVTDPRDPDADDPLLRTRDDRVEAAGVFAPPGAFAGDGGLVEGALVAVCP